jgi:UDP-glucuronate 4-epimerase
MDAQERRVLVSGGAGFIGSHLVDLLLREGGWHVTVVDNFDPFYEREVKQANIAAHASDPRFHLVEADILSNELDELLGHRDFDVIVHLAAKAGVRPSIGDPVGYQEVNVGGTQRMLDYARRTGSKRFVLASSSSVYGENQSVPWKESDPVLMPISPYAASKLAAEHFARVHAQLHGLHTTVLRFFTVYGPRQRPDLAIHQFFRKIMHGDPIRQFGDGSTQRDYTFIDDIVAGVRSAMERDKGSVYEVYNLGNSGTIALAELIRGIERVLGREAAIEHWPEQPGDVPRTFADITKATKDLGFFPATPLPEGLLRFHLWFLQHHRS